MNFNDEDLPVSILEIDANEAKKYLVELQTKTADSLKTFLNKNPQEIDKCLNFIKIVDANQSLINMFHAQDKKYLFENFNNIYLHSFKNSIKDAFLAFIEGHKIFSGQFVKLNINGDKVIMYATYKLTADFENTWNKIYVFLFNVTAAAEHETKEAVTQLSRGIIHELNNPLTIIVGLIQMLIKDTEKNASQQEDYENIFISVSRCMNILNALSIYSNRGFSEADNIKINDLINTITTEFTSKFEQKKIKINKTLFENIPDIHGNSQRLHLVFTNLISNAVDAMPDGGSIDITTKHIENNSNIEISIEDTGKGITSERLDEIFEPFHSTKPSGLGIGLGLPICKSIIDKHKGRIKVESEINKGTKVIITLKVPNE